ncbi:MIP/aquaporin family protein [Pseudonocardia nigra]|uniref:MIP/aquaporin family protein n=1 Tax=Pseudonocardia nigra TaxID=1921578 RepID=UPI001C5F508C|nr:aquaporin [Pseudonocardia nigra]
MPLLRGRPPAPRPAQGGWHLSEWVSEFFGTTLLLIGGLSAVSVDFAAASPVPHAIASPSLRLLLTGALFAGTGSLVALTPFGRRSGAHLNPAVTLAFWANRHVHRHDLAGYLVAQLLGDLAGAATVAAIWGPWASSVHYGLTAPGQGLSTLAVGGLEAGMTAALVLVIFTFVSSPASTRWTPLAVWGLVTVLVWQVAPYTGTSLNPARSLGPAVVAGRFTDLAVYLVAPPAGALGAATVWRILSARRTLTAKLYHDSRYPSCLASALPAAAPDGTR